MDVLQNLNVDPKLILVNIIGFVILLVVAKKIVFDPIGKVVTERGSDINGQYGRLESAQREMETLKADYEARLAAVEAEAREKIQSAIKEAQSARDQILLDANLKSHDIVSKAEAEAERAKEQAMTELRMRIVDIAVGTTRRIIGESLSADRQATLVDEYIATGIAEA
jgi:F-type H+-transporting ATPase subunit b